VTDGTYSTDEETMNRILAALRGSAGQERETEPTGSADGEK